MPSRDDELAAQSRKIAQLTEADHKRLVMGGKVKADPDSKYLWEQEYFIYLGVRKAMRESDRQIEREWHAAVLGQQEEAHRKVEAAAARKEAERARRASLTPAERAEELDKRRLRAEETAARRRERMEREERLEVEWKERRAIAARLAADAMPPDVTRRPSPQEEAKRAARNAEEQRRRLDGIKEMQGQRGSKGGHGPGLVSDDTWREQD